jgi:hypothetical protein
VREILILGAAPLGAAHAERWLLRHRGVPVCALNRMIYSWPGDLHAAASLHRWELPEWLKKRKAWGREEPKEVWHTQNFKYDKTRMGTSAHFAYLAAKNHGFEVIHMAGVTLEGHVEHGRPAWIESRDMGELDMIGEILTDGWLRRWMGQ